MIHIQRDSTMPVFGEHVRRVVVAPHADDEVFGCGGMLAKHPHDSVVIVLARMDETRFKEFARVKELLGYKAAYLWSFEDGYVGDDPRVLTSVLDRALKVLQPAELYIPFPAPHQDHDDTYKAGLRTARLAMGNGHHFPPTVLVYNVAAYDLPVYATELRYTVFRSLSESDIDRKVEAIHLYTSQGVDGPHPVNGLKEIAHSLGAANQMAWAETYAPVRMMLG